MYDDRLETPARKRIKLDAKAELATLRNGQEATDEQIRILADAICLQPIEGDAWGAPDAGEWGGRYHDPIKEVRYSIFHWLEVGASSTERVKLVEEALPRLDIELLPEFCSQVGDAEPALLLGMYLRSAFDKQRQRVIKFALEAEFENLLVTSLSKRVNIDGIRMETVSDIFTKKLACFSQFVTMFEEGLAPELNRLFWRYEHPANSGFEGRAISWLNGPRVTELPITYRSWVGNTNTRIGGDENEFDFTEPRLPEIIQTGKAVCVREIDLVVQKIALWAELHADPADLHRRESFFSEIAFTTHEGVARFVADNTLSVELAHHIASDHPNKSARYTAHYRYLFLIEMHALAGTRSAEQVAALRAHALPTPRIPGAIYPDFN